jgi:hypothetical protein
MIMQFLKCVDPKYANQILLKCKSECRYIYTRLRLHIHMVLMALARRVLADMDNL